MSIRAESPLSLGLMFAPSGDDTVGVSLTPGARAVLAFAIAPARPARAPGVNRVGPFRGPFPSNDFFRSPVGCGLRDRHTPPQVVAFVAVINPTQGEVFVTVINPT